MEMLPKEILDVIACPKCRGALRHRQDLFCHKCRLRFRVEGDVPNMLLEDAEGF